MNTRRNEMLPATVVWIFVIGLGFFIYVALTRPGVIGVRASYYTGYDQSQYLREARFLADGRLPRPGPEYTYGLGYPAIGAFMIALGQSNDPFFAPDAVAFAVTLALVVVLGTRLRSLRFGVLCALAIAFATPLVDFTVVPWSTTVTLVAVTGCLVVATAERSLSWRDGLAVGFAVGACFAARYVDIAFPLVIGGYALARARSWRVMLVAGIAAAAIVVLVLASHAAVFGSPWTTPYSQHLGLHDRTSDQDLRSYSAGRIPRSFTENFVTGYQRGKRVPAEPLLKLFPWVLAAPVGAVLLRRRRHRHAGPYVVAAVLSLLGVAFYTSFRATTGGLAYGDLHYFKAWIPLWGLLAAYAIAAGSDRLASSDRGASPREGRS